MHHLKYIITATALLTAINVNADLIVPDTATTAGPQSNNANPNALGGVARFKKGQVVVKGVPSDFPGYTIIKTLPHAGLVVLDVAPGKELAQIKRLKGESKKASLNFIVQQFTTVSDTFYYPYQWNFTTIQAEQAWDISTGAGVKVAVLDTGLQQGGVDGIGCVLPGIDIVSGDNDPSDGNGHGTHVSGTIAQKTNNTGTAGLAHGACILPVKVLDDAGSGTDADIAEGIAWAVANGARVINMSLGYPAGYALDQFVGSASYNALNAASNQVTIVVASGNDSSTTGISYPANHPETIAVGATGYSNLQSYPNIAPYSNQGPALDLVAPGGDMSLDLNGDGYPDGILQETIGSSGWQHYFYQGTSMASPHVAAAAAILIAQDETLDRYQVLNKLTETALDVGVSGRDNVFGYGLIQIHDALILAPPVINQAPNAAFNYSCNYLICDFTSTSIDPEEGTVSSTSWALSDGATLTGINPQHEFANAGTYDVALTVTDSEGLDNSTSQSITVTSPPVNQAPFAEFSTSCVNLECTFNSTSTDSDGQITNLVWNINSGADILGQSALTHVFSDSGDFTVALTVTDDDGAQVTTSKIVTVTAPPPPNVFPQATFSTSCVDLECTFNSTSTDSDGHIANLVWNVNGGEYISAQSELNYVFSGSGNFTVALAVTDDDGDQATVSKIVIVTAPPPNVFPEAAFAFNCIDYVCDFTSTSTDSDGTLIALSWDFGDGSNVSSAAISNEQQKTFSSNGIYTVTLTVTDDDNAQVTTSQLVTINVIETVPFYSPTSISAADNADGTATVHWIDENASGITTGFELQRRKLNTRKGTWGSWSTITSTASTSYNDASGKGTFAYQVRASNDTEISIWDVSTEVIVTSATTKGGGGTKGGGRKK